MGPEEAAGARDCDDEGMPPRRSIDAACGGGRDCAGAGELEGPELKRSMMFATFDWGPGVDVCGGGEEAEDPPPRMSASKS